MSTANEEYQTKTAEAKNLLNLISQKIQKMDTNQKIDSKNWGYAGSIGHVVEELKGIDEFLN